MQDKPEQFNTKLKDRKIKEIKDRLGFRTLA